MRKITFKYNKDYLEFINRYRGQITVYSVTITKKKIIRVLYDII